MKEQTVRERESDFLGWSGQVINIFWLKTMIILHKPV